MFLFLHVILCNIEGLSVPAPMRFEFSAAPLPVKDHRPR